MSFKRLNRELERLRSIDGEVYIQFIQKGEPYYDIITGLYSNDDINHRFYAEINNTEYEIISDDIDVIIDYLTKVKITDIYLHNDNHLQALVSPDDEFIVYLNNEQIYKELIPNFYQMILDSKGQPFDLYNKMLLKVKQLSH
jgi:sRNA-binding regulator protein Hfq